MKQLAIGALLLLCACTQPEIKGAAGSTSYSKQAFASLEHDGDLTLNKVAVKGALKGAGTLAAQKCRFGTVDWKGTATLQKVRVAGGSTFIGTLTGTKCSFKDTVMAESNAVTLNDTAIGGSLDVNPSGDGKTTLNRLAIRDDLSGMGALTVNKAEIGGFKWEGPVTLNKVKVREEANFTGALTFNECEFKGTVTATSDMLAFNEVEIEGNLVIIGTETGGEQKLILSGKSLIKGNVTFASGNGVIETRDDSRVLGQVTGTK